MVVHKALSLAEGFVVFSSFAILFLTTSAQLFIVQPELGVLTPLSLPTLLLAACSLVQFYKCITVDTTIASLKDIPNVQSAGWRYCSWCESSAPTTSKHCHQCKICVLQKDHHCHFTGRCIGKNNLPNFLVYITTLWVLALLYVLTNAVYIVGHESPGQLLITVIAPLQMFWWLIGYVDAAHCLLSVNIVLSFFALLGLSALLYHEHQLLFYNKPLIARSMPINSAGVVELSKMDRIREVFGRDWYMYYLNPTHVRAEHKPVLTKTM